MNIKTLKNKSILVFGKSRAFSSDEFASQMLFHKITVVKEYNEDVVLMVDGRMMTPDEQICSDRLYEEKKVKLLSMEKLEEELAKHIDADTLLMSLKLSHDKERLKGFLTNSMISNALFLRLLKIYDWGEENFFENDDNRDVTAALIVRFYKNIERNHNVQYATLGLMHLILQCKDEEIIEAVASLEPLQKNFELDSLDANYKIVTSIATHYITPQHVLASLVKNSNSYVKTLIAMRIDCSPELQNALYESGEEEILEALSYNNNLDIRLVEKMSKNIVYAKNIAKYIFLSEEIFDMLSKKYRAELALNESLTTRMQKFLISNHDTDTTLALSLNKRLVDEVVTELFKERSEEVQHNLYANSNTPIERLEEAYANEAYHKDLASNKNTPSAILEKLADSKDMKVLEALAKNSATPIEILYQLQLDARLERIVKENASFGKHIQENNIGWEV